MKRIKNLVMSMLFVLVVCGGGLLVGCNNGNDNMSLTLSATNVEIILGETQDNSVSVMATVTNAKDYEVTADYDSSDISVSVNYLGDGVSEIKVVAFRKCNNVDVIVKGAKKSASFTVSAIVPISSISPKENSYYMPYDIKNGGQFVLSESLFNILPNGVDGTNQTKLNYSLKSNIDGVSIQNNVLKLQPNLNDLPSAIVVEVVSAYKDTVRTEISIEVIPVLETSSIGILDMAGADAESEYNISRNNETSNTLSLIVRIPFSLSDKELTVKPVFEFNDIGLIVNDVVVEKNDVLNCYDHTFNFSIDGNSAKQPQKSDFLWFEISYSDYPEVKSYTYDRKIKITAYDEITNISCTVNGTAIDLSNSINIYTSYYSVNEGGVDGLGIRFDAIPTTATKDKLSLNVDINDQNLKYLIVKDQNGNEISFNAQGVYLFDSGTTFYFMAKTGFNLGDGISLTVSSEENKSLQKTLNFVFKDGITKLGFVYNGERIDEQRTYYLENDLSSQFSSAFVTFAVAPTTIDLTMAKVSISGDVFEIVGQMQPSGMLDDASCYEMEIRALQGKSGEGSITIKFESGQQITCSVVVFSKLDDVKIQTAPEFNTSSAVGDIKYTNNSLSYVAVKNGQSLPLIYSSDATINTTSYLFSDYVFDSLVDDVYNTESAYNTFENNYSDKNYGNLSNVISSNYLRSMQYISPVTVGKVWVKITFTGKMLQLNQSGLEYEYVDNVVEKYLLVEIYNPIVSLTVSDKNVELYAYDEVGESNKNLSMQTITVELNKNGLNPTYNKLTWNDNELINDILEFKPTNSDIIFFTVTYIGNNQYKISALTRNDNGDDTIGEDEFSETSINISAKDINSMNQSWDYTIKVSMLTPQLVEEIVLNNVPSDGIYLKAKNLSTQISDYTFRILSTVLPNDALNKNLTYKFIPDNNTNSNILTISDDGTVTVNGNIGGTGIIRVIPKDCILVDEFGNEYYRSDAENVIVDINIKIADGTSKATAIYINDLYEINNENLHYILLKDCDYTSNSVLLDTFNGGLYGKQDDYNDIATITLYGSNIFNNLGNQAIIEDINICGNVNANAMLVNVNNGTIKNVTVDLYGTNISTVNSNDVSAGGIVNINNGLILNCTFAGTIIASDFVGGIAGINAGEISSSKVLIYNMGAYGEMNFSANCVGGIVGQMSGNAILANSFLYNYSNNNSIYNNSNFGAIVGSIDSDNIKIEQCFAYSGLSSHFYAQKTSTKEDKNLIKDSYVLYAEDGAMKFAYFMSTIYGTSISGIATSNQSYNGVSFGSKTVWNINANTNYGYPYLNNTKYDEALTSAELSAIRIQNSRLSLEEVTDGNVNAGIIYVYNAYNTVLTTNEKNALISANTIDFYELFGVTKTNGILVKSSDTNIIVPSVDSLYIKNTGVCELTIMSKYDLSIEPKTITVAVLNYINNFRLEFNNYDLGANSQIKIRNGQNANIISKVQDTIVLTDRQIPLVQSDYKVNFNEIIDNVTQNTQSSYVMGDKIGVHTISATFENELQLQVSLTFDFADYNLADNIKTLLQNSLVSNTTRNVNISKSYGPISIQSSVNNAEISPSDDLVVNISLNTDLKNDNIDFVVFNGDGKKIESIFDVEIDEISSSLQNVVNYKVTVKVNESFRNIDFDINGYIIRFVSSDVNIYCDVKIKILPQEVIRIDINNYVQIDDNSYTGSSYSYYPNNVLSPGTSGLLDIIMYPAYVNYTHITVTSEPINSNKLTLISMMKNSGNSYVMNNPTNFQFIDNGVEIYAVESSEDIARFYVRVIVPSSVSLDSVFEIKVNVYNNDQVIYTEIYSLIIAPQQKAGISVDGKDVIFAVMGDTVVADIIYDQTQTLENIYTAPVGEGNVNSVVISDNNFEPYGTKYLKGTATIYVSPSDSAFYVYVETSRIMNGIKEIVYSSMLVYVIDFELNFDETTILNAEGSDEIVGNKFFYQTLGFNIGVNVTESGQSKFDSFVQNWYFANNYTNYVVNEIAKDTRSLKENLYYVNGNQEVPVVIKNADGTYSLTENDIIQSFDFSNGIAFIGKNIGTQQMLLQMQAQMPDGTTYTYKYYFTIRIENYTDEDAPDKITNAQEFISAFESEEESDYILMSDIILYDYTPINNTSKVRSIDGNGHQIVIMGFNYDQSQTTANFALFETVSENTTLKNLRINVYHVGEINVLSSATRTLGVAPVAINNYGVITNTDVVSYRYRANDIVPKVSGINVTTDSTVSVSAQTAGFVLNNYGVITNSRVGGTSVDVYNVSVNSGIANVSKITYNLDPFVISSFGEITGFVYSNSGHISSSFASNLRIINNSNIDYTTITTGFVVDNTGTITTSYAKGVKNNVSDVHATKYGIETSGISAGFVYSNSGDIRDSYSNITLTNTRNNPGRSSAGFVYINNENANIYTSLSLSTIIGSTTTQMNFAGVDERGNYQNYGNIENSYYYDALANEDTSVVIEEAYGEGAKLVNSVTTASYYYGFNFASSGDENGIWQITTTGPELISPNDISVSLRYESEFSESINGQVIFDYVNDFEYGSKNNPIIIRDAKEFDEVLSGTKGSSKNYVNKENGLIFGSYRLVNDINLQELLTEENESKIYKLASSSMSLTGVYKSAGDKSGIGKFDGNGFTIYGLALSDNGVDSDVEGFGIFSSIKDGATFMNVDIVLGATNAEGEIFGIEAKNIKYVGSLAGTVSNSTVVGVNLTSLYEGTNSVTVRGKNIVGGIIGRVVGDSYVANLSTKDISVTAVMYPESYSNIAGASYTSYNAYSRTSDEINSYVSYAGGVIGVIDSYKENTINNYNFADSEVSANANAIMIKTIGTMQIAGGTVGGVFGYVGPLTIVQDALFELNVVEDYTLQGILSYNGFAGGIVGYNMGYLRQVRSENEEQLQDQIEDSIDEYYKGDYSVDRGNEQLFVSNSYMPIAIGGLVGLSKSGKIEKSYSKLNVINQKSSYAGGIIGFVEQRGTSNSLALEEVYAFGDVRAQVAGGIIGSSRDNCSLSKVNAVNYWGIWLTDENNGSEVYSLLNMDDNAGAYSVEKTSAIYGDDIIFANNENIYNYNNGTAVIENVTSFSKITGVGDDGELFDSIFKGNDWDPNSWLRDDDELFPHIIFGYYNNVIYIRNQGDIELLRTTSGNVTFVIDPDDDGKNQIGNDGAYIVIDKRISPIVGFSNTLKGKDNEKTYGFIFAVNQNRALFETTNNAYFSNFEIKYQDNVFLNSSLSKNSAFVRTATNTEFRDLKFSDITIKGNKSNSIGIVCAEAQGLTIFDDINLTNCGIDINGISENDVEKIESGLVFASASLSTETYVSNIVINSSKIYINTSISSNNSSSVGLIGGSIQGLGDKDQNRTVINLTNVNNSTDKTLPILRSYLYFGKDSGTSTIKNTNVGYLFGNVNNAVIQTSIDVEIVPNITIDGNVQLNNVNIGGFAGKIVNSNINGINIKPSITISSNTENLNSAVYVGGIVGQITTSNVENCLIANNDNEINLEGISSAYVGSLAGSAETSSDAQNVKGLITKVKSYANITVKTKYVDNNSSSYIGGLFGGLYGYQLQNSIYYNTIELYNSASNYINLAGLCGEISNSHISKSAFTGDIKNIVKDTKDSQNTWSMPENININLRLSGFIGKTSGNCNVEENLIAGNVYPTYAYYNGNGGKYFDKSVTSDINVMQNYSYGGISAQVESGGNVTILNNICLNTHYNKLDEGLSDSYVAKALIVGKASKCDNETLNKYAHVYTLCTQNDADIGKNVLLNELLSDAHDFLGKDVDDENNFIMWDDDLFSEGTKLNPITSIVSGDTINGQYIFLGNGSGERIGNLVNSVLVSDGAVISLDDTGKQKSPIGIVDDNSYVAGVVSYVNYNNANDSATEVEYGSITIKQSVAGFVQYNAGIIYSCNVRGRSNEENKVINGLIKSSLPVAGFVAQNEGLIKESYVASSLISYYKGTENKNEVSIAGNEVSIAGFVLQNTGNIVNCYASGSIQNSEKGSTEYQGNVYAFGPGNVRDSYTICRIVNYRNSEVEKIYSFEQAQNNYYDKIALEVNMSLGDDSGTAKVTDDMSIDYASSLDDNIYKGNMSLNVNYAYGYGSFKDGDYAEIGYMHHNSGNGSKDNPYQIPNLGKLNQIADGNSENVKHYVLVQDIDAEEDLLKWETKSVNYIVLNGIDGISAGYHTISNLISIDGGIFDSIENSTVKNIIINNLTITSESSKTIYLGALGNSAQNSTITGINVFIDLNQSFVISNATNVYFGAVIGKLGNGATLSNCTISNTADNQNTFTFAIKYVSNWVVGGLVGCLDGGTVLNSSLNKNISVNFITENKFNDKTLVFGGLVGQQISGEISYASVNSKIDVFTSDSSMNGSDLTLYAGGIVGYVGKIEQINTNSESTNSENTEQGATQKIDNCYLTEYASIEAGNHVAFTTTYVGGISGYGGTISNCYNKAMSVTSYATYQYSTEPWNKYEKGSSYGDDNNVYVNDTDSKHTKLFYISSNQEAHAAGIANEYASLKDCINYSQVSGGMKARSPYAYMDIDERELQTRLWSAGSLYIGTYMACILYLGPMAGILVGSVVANSAIENFIESTPMDIHEYFFEGLDYNYSSEYYQKCQEYKAIEVELLNIANVFTVLENALMTDTDILGTPNYIDTQRSLMTLLSSGSLIDLIKTQDNKYIYSNGNLVECFDHYSDSIGLSSNGQTNRENCYSVYSGVEDNITTVKKVDIKVDINNSTKYGYMDNSKVVSKVGGQEIVNNVFNAYGLVYKANYNVSYTKSKSISEMESIQMDEDNWELYNGEWILKSAEELKKTPIDKMLNENIDFDSTGNAILNIGRNSEEYSEKEDYKTVVSLINDLTPLIPAKEDGTIEEKEIVLEDRDVKSYIDSYGISFEVIDQDKFYKLCVSLYNGGYTVKVHRNISFNSAIEPMGTKNNPFNGKFVGVSTYNNENIQINNIRIAYSNVQDEKYLGLFGYVKSLEMENITLSYSDDYAIYTTQDVFVGGIVGNVVDSGKVSINDNVDLYFSYKDYKVDKFGNKTISTAKSNIGGVVANVSDGCDVTINDLSLQKLNVELLASTMTTYINETFNSSIGVVGGIIGNAENSNISISNLNISSAFNDSDSFSIVGENSLNSVVGGIIGYSYDNNLTLSDVQINSGIIDLESNSTEVKTGGVIGHLTINKTNEININNLNVGLNKIIAKTSNTSSTTYSAGLIAYVNDGFDVAVIKLGNVSIKPNISGKKVYIMSGYGGEEYPAYAYASVCVANNKDVNANLMSQITFEAKSLSIANPNYNSFNNDDNNNYDSFFTNSKQLEYCEGFIKFKNSSNNIQTQKTNFLKIDMFESDVQISTDIENAFVNGENVTPYNYYKEYLLFVIKGQRIEDENHNVSYNNTEKVYKITINGTIRDNDFDLISDVKIEYLKGFEYSCEKQIYDEYSNSAYPLSLRTSDLYPNQIKDASKINDSDLNTNDDGNIIIDLNITINKSDTTNISGSVSDEDNSVVDVSGEIATDSTEFNNIEFDCSNGLKLIVNSERNDKKVTKQLLSFNGIISSNGWEGVSNNLNSLNLQNKIMENVSVVYGNNKVTLATYNSVEDIDLQFKTIKGNAFTVGGKSYCPYIISCESEEKTGFFSYIDYVFAKSDNNIYYLGKISYLSSEQIKTNLNRNNFFFPISDNIVEFSNDLLPINKISQTNDFNVEIVTDETIIDYEIMSDGEIHKKQTLNRTTYTITLKSISSNEMSFEISTVSSEKQEADITISEISLQYNSNNKASVISGATVENLTGNYIVVKNQLNVSEGINDAVYEAYVFSEKSIFRYLLNKDQNEEGKFYLQSQNNETFGPDGDKASVEYASNDNYTYLTFTYGANSYPPFIIEGTYSISIQGNSLRIENSKNSSVYFIVDILNGKLVISEMQYTITLGENTYTIIENIPTNSITIKNKTQTVTVKNLFENVDEIGLSFNRYARFELKQELDIGETYISISTSDNEKELLGLSTDLTMIRVQELSSENNDVVLYHYKQINNDEEFDMLDENITTIDKNGSKFSLFVEENGVLTKSDINLFNSLLITTGTTIASINRELVDSVVDCVVIKLTGNTTIRFDIDSGFVYNMGTTSITVTDMYDDTVEKTFTKYNYTQMVSSSGGYDYLFKFKVDETGKFITIKHSSEYNGCTATLSLVPFNKSYAVKVDISIDNITLYYTLDGYEIVEKIGEIEGTIGEIVKEATTVSLGGVSVESEIVYNYATIKAEPDIVVREYIYVRKNVLINQAGHYEATYEDTQTETDDAGSEQTMETTITLNREITKINNVITINDTITYNYSIIIGEQEIEQTRTEVRQLEFSANAIVQFVPVENDVKTSNRQYEYTDNSNNCYIFDGYNVDGATIDLTFGVN